MKMMMLKKRKLSSQWGVAVSLVSHQGLPKEVEEEQGGEEKKKGVRK